MKNAVLKTSNGIRESLSNLWFRDECSIAQIEDVVEDSRTGAELSSRLNNLKLFRKFTLDRETDTKVRLKSVDSFGNVSYFEAEKEPEVKKEKQLAEIITDALNGRFSKKEFCEAMSREHRYLQSEFTTLCVWWFERLAEMYEQENYDGRNEYSCKLGKMITEFLNE
jgi:IS30 family transposase